MTQQDKKRPALGRGIETLIPSLHANMPPVGLASLPSAQAGGAGGSGGTPLEIALDKIEKNPFQTRTTFDPAKLSELAQSIAATGVIQPIVVRPLPAGRYQLIMGERRVLASREAGKETIPAIVRTVSDEQAMEMTIVENLQRADLNPMEQARAYHRLSTDFKMTQEQMGIRTGQSRTAVTNFLRLIKLPQMIQDRIESGELSLGHAKLLLALETPDRISAAAQKVVALSMSVRQTENYIQGIIKPEPRTKPLFEAPKVDANVAEAESRLRRTLGLKVKIEDKAGKGRVVIDYANLEDFDALMAMLGVGESDS